MGDPTKELGHRQVGVRPTHTFLLVQRAGLGESGRAQLAQISAV